MSAFNIHITGVGGQGIGLLSQAILRGIDHADIPVLAVDTHGLAQRGGVVVSRIRMGDGIHSPLIMKNRADLVLALEVHEAMRGLKTALKKNGTLMFMDVSWQPLPVRLGKEKTVEAKNVEAACQEQGAKAIAVNTGALKDPRAQNMVLLATLAQEKLIPGVAATHYEQALEDLLTGNMLESNLAIFRSTV